MNREYGRVLAILTVGLMSSSAFGANLNMPTKANPVANYAAGGCGIFFGVNTLGSAGSVNGAVAPGTTIVQGAIGGTVGYGCPIGGTAGNFWFVSGDFDWANLNGSSTGLGLAGPAHFRQMVALGSPLSSVLGLLPNSPFGNLSTPSLPLCPTNVTCGNVYPFIFASFHEQDISASLPVALGTGREWLFSPGVGLGLEQRWSNAVVVDTTIEYQLQSTDLTVGPAKVNLGNAVVAGLTFKY